MAGQVTGWSVEKLLDLAPMQLVMGLRKRVLRANAKARLRWHGMFSKREGRVLHMYLSEAVEFSDGRREEVFLDASGVHDTLERCIRTKSTGDRFTIVSAGTYAAFSARVRQLGVVMPLPDMKRLGAEMEVVLDAFEAAYGRHLRARAEGDCLLAKVAADRVMLPLERAADSLDQAIAQRNLDRIRHLAVFDIEAFHYEAPGEARESIFARAARSGSAEVVRELALAIPLESIERRHFEGAVAVAYAGGNAGALLAICRTLGERCFMGVQPLLLALLVGGDRDALRVMFDAMRFQIGWGGALAVKAMQRAISDALLFSATPHSIRAQRYCAALAKQIDAFADEAGGHATALQQLRRELDGAIDDYELRIAIGQRAMETSAWAFQQLAPATKRFDIAAFLLEAYRARGLEVVQAFLERSGAASRIDEPVLREEGRALTLLRRCVEAGNEEAVRLLARMGATVGAADRELLAAGTESMRSLLRRLSAPPKRSCFAPVLGRPVSVDFTKSRVAVI